MTGQRFSIDTNILVYSVDIDAGARHERSLLLVDALVDRDCVLTLQALAEFFHAVTRKDKMPVDEAAAMVRDWMERRGGRSTRATSATTTTSRR